MKKTTKSLLEKFNNFEIKKAGIIPYYRDNKGQLRMLFVIPSDPAYGGDKFQIAKGHIDGQETPLQAAIREGMEECGLKQNNIKGVKLGWNGMILGYTESSEMSVFVAEVKDPVDFVKFGYEVSKTKWLTPEEFASSGRASQKQIVASCYNSIGVKDENGHSMDFIGSAGVAEMNEKQAEKALRKRYPNCEVEILPNKVSAWWRNGWPPSNPDLKENKECNHKWKPYGDFDLGGNRSEVKCVYCGVLGERDDETGEVYWPIS